MKTAPPLKWLWSETDVQRTGLSSVKSDMFLHLLSVVDSSLQRLQVPNLIWVNLIYTNEKNLQVNENYWIIISGYDHYNE